jgi:flagellar biosynthetic protein FliQ
MTPSQVTDVARAAIVVMLKLGGPIMALSLVIGLIVSFFQALTQLQEHTLTFVPKMLVTIVATLLLAPFMLSTLSTFTVQIMDRIAAG